MKYIKEKNEYLNDAFWEWFGDSKMIDNKGNPMMCYHGTIDDFNEFSGNTGHVNDEGFYGKGFYFTFGNDKGSEKEARYYGRDVMKVFLKVENPFDYSKLLEYKGVSIHIMGVNSMVFLYNIAIKFPELANKIIINKTTWRDDEGIITQTPIGVLPDLVDKYLKDLKIVEIVDGQHEEKYKSGYVKSEMRSSKLPDGGIHKWLDTDDLGRWIFNIKDEELEIGLVMEAIEKYDGLSADYHPEGYMTRNPEITETIKKRGYDGIVQSMGGDEVVVFEPNQIKSATGNNGNFNPKTGNINEHKLWSI